MRVGVVLAGPMMAIVAGRGQAIEPFDEVLLQAGLLVVHPDGGGDVHRRDEAETLAHLGGRDDLADTLRDVDELATRARVEPEILGVRAHQVTTTSASISISAR